MKTRARFCGPAPRSLRCALFVFVTLVAAVPAAGLADLGDCGQPLTTGPEPSASDCLVILQTAVSLRVCEPSCVCAPTGGPAASATDALVCLRLVTGLDETLDCPCACDRPAGKWGSGCELNEMGQAGCVDSDGDGPLELGDGQFSEPYGVAVDAAGNVYVTDRSLHRIQKFDADGNFLGKWGSVCRLSDNNGCVDPDGAGPLELGDGQFSEPAGVAVDEVGNIYVGDDGNRRIQKFDSNGNFLMKWGSECFVLQIESCVDPDGAGPLERGDGQFIELRDLAVGGDGFVYVPDGSNHRIQKFDLDGNFIGKWEAYGGAATRDFVPRAIAVDEAANVYSSGPDHSIEQFSAAGLYLDNWAGFCRLSDGAGCTDPDGAGPLELGDGQQFQFEGKMAAGHGDRLYSVDDGNSRVQSFRSDGTFVAKWGSECCFDGGSECFDPDGDGPLEAGDGQFCGPRGIAAGPGKALYVAEAQNRRIQRFDCR